MTLLQNWLCKNVRGNEVHPTVRVLMCATQIRWKRKSGKREL